MHRKLLFLQSHCKTPFWVRCGIFRVQVEVVSRRPFPLALFDILWICERSSKLAEFLFCPNKVEWIETKGLLNNIKWLNSICLIPVYPSKKFSCRFFFVHFSHPSSLKQFFILSAEQKQRKKLKIKEDKWVQWRIKTLIDRDL